MSPRHIFRICFKGHLSLENLNNREHPHCECGAKFTNLCPNCQIPIKILDNSYPFDRPNCCYSCGKLYPWSEAAFSKAIVLISKDQNFNHLEKTSLIRNIQLITSENPRTLRAAERIVKLLSKTNSNANTMLFKAILRFSCRTANNILIGL